MSRSHHFFTSESVSEGHPDKIADQVADLVLDQALAQDPQSRVACECLVKTGMVLIAGEMTTHAWVDMEQNVRRLIHHIGYTDPSLGFDADSCAVLNAIGQQSSDIAQGVDHLDPEAQGAGDQGLVFGYACDETDVYMPAPITYAHRLTRRQANVRKQGQLPWLGPDAKSQVTIRYENHRPAGIDSVVLSTQHAEHIQYDVLKEAVMDEIIKPVLPVEWITDQTRFYINPTGRFVLGGPQADCGLTGRKIIVDTYGGKARHGGGAFSGKDPSKVDRSASYAARHAAKNIVAAGLAKACEIQIAYAIGVAHPTSVSIDTYGTGVLADETLESIVRDVFDFRPYGIVQALNLLQPIYQATSTYGHFGRLDQDWPWERIDTTDKLKAAAGLDA